MTAAEIRHLFAYTDWANARVLDAAAGMGPDLLLRDVGISHSSILGTLLHVAGADTIWLERWRGHSPIGNDVWAGWTARDAQSLPQVRDHFERVIRTRTDYLEPLTDAEVAADLTYRRFNGTPFSLPLAQQLLHVVNHATLHRGQVVATMRQLGVAPPTTDLLFYVMETRQGAH